MKKRSEVDIKETWALEDLFKSDEDFFASLSQAKKMAEDFKENHQDIKTSEDVVASLDDYCEILGLLDRLGTFAGISTEVDTTDEGPAKRYAKFSDEYAKIQALLSFYDLSLLAVDSNVLEEVIKNNKGYAYYLERLVEKKDHLLSSETEEIGRASCRERV